MINVVSWAKYIYSFYNPVIRKLSYLLFNRSHYKIGTTAISIILFVVFFLYIIDCYKHKQRRVRYNSDNNNKNRLYLLTQFNTFLNTIMPIDIESFSRSTYIKILQGDFQRIYPKLFSSLNKRNKIKTKNLKVSFDDNNITFLI
jgi:hypothetical protein